MTEIFELRIEGEIPEENADVGPEAQVATKAHVAALVTELTNLGLVNVVGTRRVRRRTGPRAATASSADSVLTQEVAAELAAQPETPTPVTTHRGRGTHQAQAEAAE
jgi:hypothetical protein